MFLVAAVVAREWRDLREELLEGEKEVALLRL